MQQICQGQRWGCISASNATTVPWPNFKCFTFAPSFNPLRSEAEVLFWAEAVDAPDDEPDFRSTFLSFLPIIDGL